VLLALEEVLAQRRTDVLEEKTQMRRDRVVAQDRVAGLKQVAHAQRRQAAEKGERDRHAVERRRVTQEQAPEGGRRSDADRQDHKSRRERQQQRVHRYPPPNGGTLVRPTEGRVSAKLRAPDCIARSRKFVE